MSDEVVDIAGTRTLALAADGPLIAGPLEASDVMGAVFSAGVGAVAIPVARLDPGFFKLATGVAGEVLQKFVNYRVHVTVLGDVEPFVANSKPLADFVRESNRGVMVWFLADLAALQAKRRQA